MRIGKIAVAIIGLVPFNVYAECTPAPDCASIGYTETSCETISLKCPFDQTKLYCFPCDSSFKYDCTGDNITGGTGSACGGKYVSCECESGLPFNNGVCPQNCTVGMIYYSDRTCSTELDNSKTPIGVVVKDNELITALTVPDMPWGTYGTDVDALAEITSETNAKADYNGVGNTALLVAFQTTEGLTASNSAAIYCNEYAPTGMESSKGQWYLPAAGEVYDYIYGNYRTVKATWDKVGTTIPDSYFWSSSERTIKTAWYVYSGNDNVTIANKHYSYSVSCFLAL